LIDNEEVRFDRFYEFTEGSALINFKTKLTVKSTGLEMENSAQLFAIRKSELQEYLENAGFGQIEFYGNFKADPLTTNSLPLIVTATKP
jgi:hypothetical protein